VATRAAATGDLHASTDYTTIKNISIIIRPAALSYIPADKTQPLSLPPQSLLFCGVPTVPASFPAYGSHD